MVSWGGILGRESEDEHTATCRICSSLESWRWVHSYAKIKMQNLANTMARSSVLATNSNSNNNSNSNSNITSNSYSLQ